MNRLDLSGVWDLRDKEKQVQVAGQLPGCNYLDLMKHGMIEDPFWGENEKEMTKLAEKDYEYAREFDISPELLLEERIELVITGLDTLAEIILNNKIIASTDNVHRTYRFSVKDYLKERDNHIKIIFRSPFPYLEEKNQKDKIPFSSGMGVDGISHIRKVQCHFGWDWGPILPPVGITGSIELQGYSNAKIDQVTVIQRHETNKVSLIINAKLFELNTTNTFTYKVQINITSPQGKKYITESQVSDGCGEAVVEILNPELWWCNGLGNQSLYQVEVSLLSQEEELDHWNSQIGLRTIVLDTTKDKWGNNFRFLINGVPIFAKGADWIPSDSFISRTSKEDLEFYIQSAHQVNMNMLRVWGGGYYESEDFYDLCDKYGILVWQDFCFACAPYPFYDVDFLNNVEAEVRDNIRRIRHHASLALWCGNNEIELIAMMWKKNKRLFEANQQFFHDTLADWVKSEDSITPYWPGSPNSGTKDDKANDFNKGDTHLWQIWHGMMPIEHFRKMPTRFCSEFGMESLPSMKAIQSFTDKKEPSIFDPVMLSHQKSKGGNQKMLFYLLAKYRNPSKLEDFVYLSQLVQSETVREATEEWKRNFGRCNGAIYWQYNDCWPVASWAGIDYQKQYKAVMYKSKQFNSLLSASVDITKDKAAVYVINEYPQVHKVTLNCILEDFEGNKIWEKNKDIEIGATLAAKELDISFSETLKGHKKNNAVLVVSIYEEEKVIFQQTRLIVPDKEALLSSPHITRKLKVEGNKGVLTLSAKKFARYVYVDIDGIDTPLSDNYFDIRSGKDYTITFEIPQNILSTELEARINIKSLADIPNKGNRLEDKRLRMMMRLHKDNFLTWIIFKFI
ncbi:MAG: beta-mannosidase [Herbinix sp.]|jgi:beta-mannosidase|nr:beta-mannosidase [Herbinix sp.]